MLELRKGLFLVFLIAAISIPLYDAQAQLPASTGGLELSVSSENPIPGQTLTITAKSYNTDINTASITWTVNGSVISRGTGVKTLEVKAPALGQRTTVSVTAIATNGETLRNSVSLGSGYVDMIVETDGYVPPFFRGKLNPSYQNIVKIVAIPHLANSQGAEYDPKTLVYQWKQDSKVIEDQSGYGRQSISMLGEVIPRAHTISVTVTPRDGSAQAMGITSIDVESPTIEFYIDDPLYGPFFNRAVRDGVSVGSEKEVRVLSVPFGFNKPLTGQGDLTYTWAVNGNARSELSENQSIILRAPEETGGSANIGLQVQHRQNILQGTRSGFNVQFRANGAAASAISFE